MFRKLSLQNRVLILVSSVTILTMSVIVGFDSYSLQRSVEETYVSQLEGMTTAINGRYEESHSFKDVQQIFDYIQYKNSKVLQLTLYGQNEVHASTDRSRIGDKTPIGLIRQMEKDQATVIHLHDPATEIPIDRLTAPLKEDGATIGAIELILDTSENYALVRNRITFNIAVALTSTALLLIALWFIIRKLVIHPLLRIRAAAVSVKQGVPYDDITLHSSQELEEVATAFNEMVHDLEGRYRELQEAMTTIQEAQKQLVESEKMVALGSLVAGVSHEINTPIGIGVTAASFLDEKSRDFLKLYQQNQMKRSDLDEYLKTVSETTGMIQSNLQRASELVKSFKQVAVDSSAHVKRKFLVKAYVEEVLKSLQPQLKKKKHTISVKGDAGLELYTDPGVISQILTNFIMNSLIHAYSNDDQGQMVIEVTRAPGYALLHYSDDGKGMTPEVLAQIFDPFFTTNRSSGGTGLGMHIVYNLVTQSLGGTISCESHAGKGTDFTIQIPMNEG
ncbi:sensor histidine kinase [Paenibacillus gansuensis]|uniref:histidine kinase n=1 Tax=Paenibacillus gansuensis TaxID=306542 RepID=A0ABW5P8J6_9BACL